MLDDSSPRFTGVPWFRKDDWHELHQLFSDENDPFPETWEAWYSSAIAAEAYLTRHGGKVIRVQIQPEEFRGWCRNLDIVPNANARARWANGVAAREFKKWQEQQLPGR
jgi:hypothetical protein